MQLALLWNWFRRLSFIYIIYIYLVCRVEPTFFNKQGAGFLCCYSDRVVCSVCTWAGLLYKYMNILYLYILYVKHMGPQLLVPPEVYLLWDCFNSEPLGTFFGAHGLTNVI